MSYKISSALNQFNKVSNELRVLIDNVSSKDTIYSSEIKQAVYRSAIFQTSAALEEYIKSVFESWIYKLCNNNKSVDSLPNSIIYFTVGRLQLSSMQSYLLNGNEADLIKSLSNIPKLKMLFNSSTLVNDVIDAKQIVNDKKFPAINNINSISKRFGINDFFSLVNAKGKRDYKYIVTSFNDIRNEIAHNFPSSDLTKETISKNLVDITDFASKADMVICNHVIAFSGDDCWQTE